MNIKELMEHRITDAVNFHQELNPQLYLNEKMRPEIRNKLLKIAHDFQEFIGISDIALMDITVSGSNAAF